MTKISDEVLDQLLGGAKTQEAIFGPDGVLKRMTAALVERALGAELAHHLVEEPPPTGEERNRRHGTRRRAPRARVTCLRGSGSRSMVVVMRVRGRGRRQ